MSKFNELLQKEMTRKQFLILLGSGLISLFGLSTFLGLFTKTLQPESGRPGYGEHHYGP